MHSPKLPSSPSYKNLRYKHSQSPIELKEKMRKDYKNKIQNCRDMLLNRFRDTKVETELRCTLNDLYKNAFNFTENLSLNEEENELLEEIKKELIQEELDWLTKEYEKSQMDYIDWSSYQIEEHVICPICQKNNFQLHRNILSCEQCKIGINTNSSLEEIRQNIYTAIDKHGTSCDPQFSLIPEAEQTHIYLICDSCIDMHLIV